MIKKFSLETAFKENSSLMGNVYFLLLTVPVAVGGVFKVPKWDHGGEKYTSK